MAFGLGKKTKITDDNLRQIVRLVEETQKDINERLAADILRKQKANETNRLITPNLNRKTLYEILQVKIKQKLDSAKGYKEKPILDL